LIEQHEPEASSQNDVNTSHILPHSLSHTLPADAGPWQPQPTQEVSRSGHGFPDEKDFLSMRAGQVPVLTAPASRLPRSYRFSSPASPSLNSPLNDQEALLFFVYERWRQRWWHLNPPWGAYAWQLPFDPMASPWHWDRHTLLSGLMVSVGGLLEYVRSGGLLRLGAHLGAAAAFPLTASKIHNPETRDMGFVASGCLNAAVGGYGAYQVCIFMVSFSSISFHFQIDMHGSFSLLFFSHVVLLSFLNQFFTRPRRPVPWGYFLMFAQCLPSSVIHMVNFWQFNEAKKQLGGQRPLVRVYNAQLMPQYFAYAHREQERLARERIEAARALKAQLSNSTR
jgi:hypothetical protein